MSAVDRFSNAATAAGATVHTIDRAETVETLEKLATPPTVGAPLSIDGVSLPEDVETEPDEEELRAASTGITGVTIGIETLGSVVVPSDGASTGPISLYPERQVAVIERENIVGDVESAFSHLAERYRSNGNDAVLVTGPSSTGDMGALVTGVHGPAELHVVVIDNE